MRSIEEFINFNQTSEQAFNELTEEEKQLIRLVCLEKTNREIAGAMGITEKKTRDGLKNLYEKLHLKGRLELLLSAIKNALVFEG